jgi:hypothetical protein
MNWPEPAEPHELGDAARIVSVRLYGTLFRAGCRLSLAKEIARAVPPHSVSKPDEFAFPGQ